MFQFPRFAPRISEVTGFTPARFPHSGTPGSMPACSSPRLFAACHALLRPPVPRHPLHALFARNPLYYELDPQTLHYAPAGQNLYARSHPATLTLLVLHLSNSRRGPPRAATLRIIRSYLKYYSPSGRSSKARTSSRSIARPSGPPLSSAKSSRSRSCRGRRRSQSSSPAGGHWSQTARTQQRMARKARAWVTGRLGT